MDYEIRRATAADYQELIDFARMVFYVDFPYRLPKLYNNHPEMAEHHLLVTEAGRIKALVGSFPLELRVGDSILKIRGIGTVSVHPDCRGKGYMKLLMNQLVREAAEEGADLLCLGGQRQRYEYFGFGQAASHLEFTLTSANRRHWKEISTREIHLLPLDENGEYLSRCLQLQQSQPVAAARKIDTFGETLHTWDSSGWVILNGNEFLGYASIHDEGTIVQELVLTDYRQVPQVLFRIAQNSGKESVCFCPAWEQTDLIATLNTIAESASISNGEMVHILNYPRVLEAYLGLKAARCGIRDGKYVVDVKDAGRFAMVSENNRVQVTETSEKPEISLSPTQFPARIFAPSAIPLQQTALERDWFPVPMTLPLADLF